MLTKIGKKSINDLYSDVDDRIILKRELDLPSALSELEVEREVRSILEKNISFSKTPVFLGSGVWPHHVPAAVDAIVGRTEFYTSYTPYQAEISQGMLQSLFEYQSLMAELLEMDIVNSSMYDWASALGEAARMAGRITHRDRLLVSQVIAPERMAVLRAYAEPANLRIDLVAEDEKTGQVDTLDLQEKISDDYAAVYIENPNFFGCIESNVHKISEMVHKKGVLFIVGIDPISLGILKAPGEYGADIVVGEGQPLGNHMNFGGPLLGVFACRNENRLLRQMPGRLIGLTESLEEKAPGYCMVLQTREQHIRRERATSNICSNEALCAVAAAVYLSLLGPRGIKQLGENIIRRSHYVMSKLSQIKGVKAPLFDSCHFKEFVVNIDTEKGEIEDVQRELLETGIQGGRIIKNAFPRYGESAVYCVTEKHSQEMIDRLTTAFNSILEGS
jgi:glycine dehydrogenase subunit 1